MSDDYARIQIEALVSRIELLEAQMRALQGGAIPAGPGVDDAGFAVTTPAADPEVVALLQQGKKINAIKVHREKTGLDLAEAKAAVDRLEAQLGL